MSDRDPTGAPSQLLEEAPAVSVVHRARAQSGLAAPPEAVLAHAMAGNALEGLLAHARRPRPPHPGRRRARPIDSDPCSTPGCALGAAATAAERAARLRAAGPCAACEAALRAATFPRANLEALLAILRAAAARG